MLDKRLGKGFVNLQNFAKNFLDKKKVKVGNNGAERVISELAGDNMQWLQHNYAMSKADVEKNLPIIWNDFVNMSDENLCLAFRRIHGVYNGMKANGMLLGDDAVEAKATIEAIDARMEAMSNPYYDVLDPKAFDKVPSGVLEEIITDPEFYEQEPDIYAEEQVSPAYLGVYLKHVMEHNKAREELQLQELEAGLNQNVEEAVTELRLMRIEYTKGDENKKKEMLKKMNEAYRNILAAALILDDAKKKPVRLDTEEFYDLLTKDTFLDRTKDIPDGNIESFRSSFGENSLYTAIRDGGRIGVNLGVKALKDALYVPPVPQTEIPQPPAPPTEAEIKRAWFNDLAKQLKEMGINDPMSMQLLRVRGDASYSELEALPTNFEGGMRLFQIYDDASKPALMPVDKDGNLINPLKPGENPASWAFANMPVDLELISDEQVDYLYRMAKENRLHLECADPGFESIFKNRYIGVSSSNKAAISKELVELDAEFKAKPDAKVIGGYTREAFNELFEKDSEMCNIEASCATQAVSIEMKGEANAEAVADDPGAKDYFDYTKDTYYAMRNSRIGFRDAYCHAFNHKEWYLAEEDAKNMCSRFIALRKREDDRLPEERDIDNYALPASEEFELMAKGILKKTGCKTISEAMEGNTVKFAGEDDLPRTDTLEFMIEVSKRLLNGGEVLLNGAPYTFGGGYGLKPGINKDAYVKEFMFLADRLTKTEGNWTSNSPEYDALSALGHALPGQTAALSGDMELNFDKLEELINPVVAAGDSYITTHKGSRPDSRQTERLKIINRFKDLAAEIKAKNYNPGKNYDYRIAEKIVTAGIIKMKKPELLMNEAYRTTCIEKTLNSEAFKAHMAAMTSEDKLNVLKTPGKSVLKSLYPDTTQVLADPELHAAPAQPQLHN